MSTHSVYVIEIMPRWHDLVAPGLPKGKRCFYVGQTGKSLTERFWEHRTGRRKDPSKGDASAKVFRRMRRYQGGSTLSRIHDVRLRRTLMDQVGPLDADASLELESATVDFLRDAGHCVYPKNVGFTQFEAYLR